MTRIAFLAILMVLLAGCDFWIYQIEPTPTAAPPPPPGSACAVVSIEQLQAWMNEKLPRSEKEVPGGVVYLDTPRVTNCDANKMYFQLRMGYQRGDLVIEIGLLEHSFDLRYDEGQGNVCLDLVGILGSPDMAPQGVQQVGQSIKVAEVRSQIEGGPSPLDSMPPEVRQQFDQAVKQGVGIQGGDPQAQGIGDNAAQILLNWAVGDLLQRFNDGLAQLIGACIPTR
jgi:hypothetical protein